MNIFLDISLRLLQMGLFHNGFLSMLILRYRKAPDFVSFLCRSPYVDFAGLEFIVYTSLISTPVKGTCSYKLILHPVILLNVLIVSRKCLIAMTLHGSKAWTWLGQLGNEEKQTQTQTEKLEPDGLGSLMEKTNTLEVHNVYYIQLNKELELLHAGKSRKQSLRYTSGPRR